MKKLIIALLICVLCLGSTMAFGAGGKERSDKGQGSTNTGDTGQGQTSQDQTGR